MLTAVWQTIPLGEELALHQTYYLTYTCVTSDHATVPPYIFAGSNLVNSAPRYRK